MNSFSRYVFLAGLGGALYYSIELMFRGYSHWSMFLLGGICFLYCGIQNDGSRRYQPLWKQVVKCGLFVTTGEFITGVFVNLIMNWNVWDYTDRKIHIMGQICPLFMIIFTFFCLIAIVLEDYLSYWLYGGEKPVYMKNIHNESVQRVEGVSIK